VSRGSFKKAESFPLRMKKKKLRKEPFSERLVSGQAVEVACKCTNIDPANLSAVSLTKLTKIVMLAEEPDFRGTAILSKR
jgi:hypothetical protein